MILYKYVSFETGKRILETNSVCFSQPKDFNDPFDTPSYPDEAAANPVERMFARMRTMMKDFNPEREHRYPGAYANADQPVDVGTLRRQASRHGYRHDALAAGFTDEKTNMIPAQFGSMVYVTRRSDDAFIDKPQSGMAVGATFEFRPRSLREAAKALSAQAALLGL